jgi:alkylhydroperoxidase/carboxymuconolactone decarboxylase family protein YurZ
LTTQCAYCLETHTGKARKLGVSPEELSEIVYITAALRAGAAAAHGTMAMKLYEGSESQSGG